MKKIFGLVLLIVSFNVFGQNPTNYQYRTVRERLIAFMIDSTFHLPRYNGAPSGIRTGASTHAGAMAVDTTNERVYFWSDYVWHRLAKYSELATASRFGVEDIVAGQNRNFSGLNNTYGLTLDSLNNFFVKRNNISRIYMNSTESGITSGTGLNGFEANATEVQLSFNAGENLVYVKADSTSAKKKLSYPGNIHGTFFPYSLVDKSYVDSLVGTAGVSDGDKGDITVSSTGTVFTIDNNVVSDAKLRQSAGLSLIGRSASTTGNVADISASTSEAEQVMISNSANVLQFAKPNLIKRRGNTIGTVFEKSDFSDTTGITTYSSAGETTYTIVNGDELRIYTPSAPSGTNYFEVDSFTNLDVAEIYARYFVDDIAAQTYVFITGVSGSPFGTGVYLSNGALWTAADANLGKALINTYVDATNLQQVFSVDAIPLSEGDEVETKWTTFENMVMYSVRNITQNSAWVSTPPIVLKNTETKYGVGKVRITTYIGDYRLVSLKYSSKQIKGADVYLFGDSKFTKSVYQNTSIPSRLNNDYLSVVANSGVNNTLADLVNASWEVINHVKPKAVVINSSNDIRFGVSSGTWQANIDTLYNRFTRYGIRVYFTCFYESSSSQAAMDTYLAANYSDYYFRTTYTALQACGSGCLVADNIHLSDEGTKMAVDEIMKDGRLNGNWWSDFKDVGTIVPTTPSSGYGKVYTRADSLRFKNDAGTEFTLGTESSSIPLSSLTAAAASNTINNGNHIQEWQWDALTAKGFIISSTYTGATSFTQKLFNIEMDGTHGASGVISRAATISNGHSGTSSTNYGIDVASTGGTTNYGINALAGNGTDNYAIQASVSTSSATNYGIYTDVTGTSSTNYGGRFKAYNGTNNYAIVTEGGNIGFGTATPSASALLEIASTTQGLLLPRMTKAQRDAISSPVAGLMVYQTDNTPGLRVYNGTNWMRFTETAD